MNGIEKNHQYMYMNVSYKHINMHMHIYTVVLNNSKESRNSVSSVFCVLNASQSRSVKDGVYRVALKGW